MLQVYWRERLPMGTTNKSRTSLQRLQTKGGKHPKYCGAFAMFETASQIHEAAGRGVSELVVSSDVPSPTAVQILCHMFLSTRKI